MSLAAPVPEVIGRYAIYGKIASGGMASVHFGRLAGAAGFSRTVAVKRLHAHLAEDPEFLATMIDEARLAARIHHPNVVPTLDVVASNRELLVVMEYVRGESLAKLLKAEASRARKVPLSTVSGIVVGALHGLHAAHEATNDRGLPLGIVHRDVSPQNILVDVDGAARIIDFGVATAAERLQTTRAGVVKGKVAYMAPEQLRAEVVTRTADIYAMGVVLWELLTGRRLFKGDGDAQLVLQVLAGVGDPPSRHAPEVPAALDALVMKALAREASDRFSSALAMAEALRDLVAPAFPTEIGKWVAEVATETLARRGATLADIESRSDVASLLAPPRPRSPASESTEDVPTVASRSLSRSRPTPVPGVAGQSISRRTTLAGAMAASLIAIVAIVVAWRTLVAPGPVAARAAVAPSAASSVAPLPSASHADNTTPSASSPASAVASERASPVASERPAPTQGPTVSPARPRQAPKPTASPFRFAQPD
jgi:serine/threonine-protein kinase